MEAAAAQGSRKDRTAARGLREPLKLTVVVASFAVVVSLVAAVAVAASPAAAASYEVGAAKVDVTPPPLSETGATPAAFARCPATMAGPRLWAFEEPYVDVDGSGDFNYPEPGRSTRALLRRQPQRALGRDLHLRRRRPPRRATSTTRSTRGR